MTISEANQKTLDTIAKGTGPIKMQEIADCVRIWRESHHGISRVVNPSRWFKSEGMPQFISDLALLLANWNNDDSATQEIERLVAARLNRDSISTNDKNSNSTRITLALCKRLGIEDITETVTIKATDLMKPKSADKVRMGYTAHVFGNDEISREALSNHLRSQRV